MRIFRRKRGRHALGAAVTSIPSGPLAPPARELPFGGPAEGRPDLAAPPAGVPEPLPAAPRSGLLDALPVATAANSVLVPVQAPPVAARVQLGFRDGTSTALDPASAQSRALEQLATSLARRD